MIVDQKLLDSLTAQAKANPRLRQAYDLRTSPWDGSQRMLNALEPGTMMPVHRHMKTSESIAMFRDRMVMRLYDDNGAIAEEFIMEPGGERTMVQVEASRWHSLEVLDEGTVVFEAKDGRYEPLAEEDIMTRIPSQIEI